MRKNGRGWEEAEGRLQEEAMTLEEQSTKKREEHCLQYPYTWLEKEVFNMGLLKDAADFEEVKKNWCGTLG